MNIQKEILRYSKLNQYPIDQFDQLVCTCASKEFELYSDDEEGGALAVCVSCGAQHDIEKSAKYIEQRVQNVCRCGSANLNIGIGKSYYPDTTDVRWMYIGAGCKMCNLVGVYVDWQER